MKNLCSMVYTSLLFTSLRNVSAAFGKPLRTGDVGILRGGADRFNSRHSVGSKPIFSTMPRDAHQLEVSPNKISQTLQEEEFGGIPYKVSSPLDRYQVIFVLGGPGAGKGTQCDNLLEHYSAVHHFSVGELLRNASGPQKEMIDSYLVSGKIVPVDVSLGLLEKAMAEKGGSDSTKCNIYLVDGFPRNFDNLDGWRRIMSNTADVVGTMLFDCPIEELERRILIRGETSGRSDDNIASARKRFATFEAETMPVVHVLEQETKIFRIEGDKSRDEVWASTKEAMDNVIQNYVLDANKRILESIAERNVNAYKELCALDCDSDFSADEHFNQECVEGMNKNVIMNAGIKVYGDSAVVSYERSILNLNNEEIGRVKESRTWSYEHGRGWRNIHIVRELL